MSDAPMTNGEGTDRAVKRVIVRCTKCGTPFEYHHHKHMTRDGAFHTSCYKTLYEDGKERECLKAWACFINGKIVGDSDRPPHNDRLYIYRDKYMDIMIPVTIMFETGAQT